MLSEALDRIFPLAPDSTSPVLLWVLEPLIAPVPKPDSVVLVLALPVADELLPDAVGVFASVEFVS